MDVKRNARAFYTWVSSWESSIILAKILLLPHTYLTWPHGTNKEIN
ncbi:MULTISPECIES: hypothetical protein [Metallosphaera]|nr:hypothetical protein [Metallosphaera sedula]MCH1770443.1 hypothetical protein [Metallosphaera sedula]